MTEKCTVQDALMVALGILVAFQLANTVLTGYNVIVGDTSLAMFTETFAVFVMVLVLALMGNVFRQMRYDRYD